MGAARWSQAGKRERLSVLMLNLRVPSASGGTLDVSTNLDSGGRVVGFKTFIEKYMKNSRTTF